MNLRLRNASSLTVVLVVLVLGCGGDDDDKETPTGPANGVQNVEESSDPGSAQIGGTGEIAGDLLSEPNSAHFTITYQPSERGGPFEFEVTHYREWSMEDYLAGLQQGNIDYPELLVINDAAKDRLSFQFARIPPDSVASIREFYFLVQQEFYGKNTLTVPGDVIFNPGTRFFQWETSMGTQYDLMMGFGGGKGEITFSRFSTKRESIISGTLDITFHVERERGGSTVDEGEARIQGTFTTAPLLSTGQ